MSETDPEVILQEILMDGPDPVQEALDRLDPHMPGPEGQFVCALLHGCVTYAKKEVRRLVEEKDDGGLQRLFEELLFPELYLHFRATERKRLDVSVFAFDIECRGFGDPLTRWLSHTLNVGWSVEQQTRVCVGEIPYSTEAVIYDMGGVPRRMRTTESRVADSYPDTWERVKEGQNAETKR